MSCDILENLRELYKFFSPHFLNPYRTHDGNMGGVRLVTQRALNGLSGMRQVSVQEAVHMVDNQDLVICSESITHLGLARGALLKSEKSTSSSDILSMYRNRSKKNQYMSLDSYFYKVFCREALKDGGTQEERTKHRMLIPKGLRSRPTYPVDYHYARAMLIMHKPWSKDRPLTELLKDTQRTIDTFENMIYKKQLPSSIVAQYITAMKYTHQKKLEMTASQGTQQKINVDDLDEDEIDELTAFQQLSHFSDNKHHSRVIDGMTVDIGTDVDWTLMRFSSERDVTLDGKDWITSVTDTYYKNATEVASSKQLVIPKQKNGKNYSVRNSEEQSEIVYTAVDTIIKFLNNDPSYKPMRATVMGCGGTGKSFIINTIIAMVRKLTDSNDTVQVAAPSGAAAFNVQGSTIHRLLTITPNREHIELGDAAREKLKRQLEHLLILIIDERSMINSKVLAAAERNTRHCIYNGQNSTELWGGLPVVILFGDDYQLMPIASEGAIQGYASRQEGIEQYVTSKMKDSQLLAYQGSYLFTEVMTEKVYFLTKNYRVQCEKFKALLGRVREGQPSPEDVKNIMKLHLTYHETDKDFMNKIKNDPKTMWLFTTNEEKDKKNVEKLVQVSKENEVPVARLNCWWGTNKLQNGTERHACKSHFDRKRVVERTNICVGARVAIKGVNHLPEIGLYNGSIGTVIEIVYKDNPVGPNDRQNCSLPDYVVVDIPHLNLPPNISPWDKNHPTVSEGQNCVFVLSVNSLVISLHTPQCHSMCQYHHGNNGVTRMDAAL